MSVVLAAIAAEGGAGATETLLFVSRLNLNQVERLSSEVVGMGPI